jgi:large subunit ribosomal protein L13
MKAIGTKTYSATASQAQAGQRWYVIDAEGQVLGRVATTVAQLLRGKGKPTFTPHMDCGDFVVVVNAEKIVVTGNKEIDKLYRRHSNFPGGLRTTRLKDVREKHPARILESAVRGMLPKGALGNKIYLHMKVYAGPDHPHQAQKPVALDLLRDGHKRGQVIGDNAPVAETATAE